MANQAEFRQVPAVQAAASAHACCDPHQPCDHPVHRKWQQDQQRHTARLVAAGLKSEAEMTQVYRFLREIRGPTFADAAHAQAIAQLERSVKTSAPAEPKQDSPPEGWDADVPPLDLDAPEPA